MSSPLESIKHVVVLMLENRSFDNILGGLSYTKPLSHIPASSRMPFDGILDANGEVKSDCRCPSNPKYLDEPNADPQWVMAKPRTRSGFLHNEYVTPQHDPDEEFDHMTFQIFGMNNVMGKSQAPMNGFWIDFRDHHKLSEKSTIDEIMECFSPDQLPIISTLATEFAVSDRWFASCPTQTYPNRAFGPRGHVAWLR